MPKSRERRRTAKPRKAGPIRVTPAADDFGTLIVPTPTPKEQLGRQREVFAFTMIWPLAFLLWSWWLGGGFPSFIDNNETAWSLVHARNLIDHDPKTFSWLTADTTDPKASVVTGVYTHNPNFPRYLHYLLFRLGISRASVQILILGAIGTALAVFLAWRALGEWPVIPIVMSIDFTQFLAWTGNTYRIWTFALFFGVVLAARRAWRPWQAGLLAFVLYQFEYGYALFATTLLVLICLLLGWRRRFKTLAGFAAGALVSAALFFAQVISYYGGSEGLRAELASTIARRGLPGNTPSQFLPTRLFLAALGGLIDVGKSIGTHYRPIILLLVVLGIAFAGIQLARRRASFPAGLLFAVLGGLIVTSMALRNYYIAGYVGSLLPLFGFVIWLSVGVVADEAGRRIGRPLWAAALVVVPMVGVFAQTVRLPFPGEVFRILERDFKGRAILTNSSPHVYGLTGGRTYPTAPGHPTLEEVGSLSFLRDPDGRIAFVCIDIESADPAFQRGPIGNYCPPFVQPLIRDGHRILKRGRGYTILAIDRGY